MGNRVYTTTEYGTFITGKEAPGCQTLPRRTFELLREFVLTDQPTELMTLTCHRGLGESLTARNYVGVIALPDGAVIQILPKIFSAVQDDSAHTKAKQMLLDMLRTLRGPDGQRLPKSRVDTEKMDILEIFIRMFLDELLRLVQRGIKCGYETTEENLNRFKGKLLFSQQVRYNFAHQERCYVAYDQFTPNRPENRLIKSTLLLLQRKSGTVENQRDIKRFLHDLEQVEPSKNIVRDLEQCAADRSMTHYREVLRWCRVFLGGRSFSSFQGEERAIALLYPMERLFESYVAERLRQTLDAEKYELTVQGPCRWLIEDQKAFQMRPDLVVRRRSDDALFILDTKWKLLEETRGTLNISQADMYQMYAYQKKYGAQNVTLLYPRTDKIADGEEHEFRGGDDFHVFVRFVDLLRMRESIEKMMYSLEETYLNSEL